MFNYSIQDRITEWAVTTFGAAIEFWPLYQRFLMEFDELDREATALFDLELSEFDGKEQKRLASEMADVMITLYNLAGQLGVDLDQAIEDKQTINEGRKWTRHGDGTGQHIKENV